jgi:hypothetical protein
MQTPRRPGRPQRTYLAFDAMGCPQDNGDGYQYYPLGFSPPAGQYIRVKYQGGGTAPSRFIIWSDEGSNLPSKYVAQISGNSPSMLGLHWPGGGLWYTFQHCYGNHWFDYRETGRRDNPVYRVDGCSCT